MTRYRGFDSDGMVCRHEIGGIEREINLHAKLSQHGE
jgi:hypothetical protein